MTTDKVQVVAAVIERDGRVLLQQRDPEDSFSYMWCSPGGKVEPGETDEEALRRELRQECGVDALIGEPLFAHEINERVVRFYRARLAGTPDRRVGVGIGWFTLEERRALAMTPADAAFRAFEARADVVWKPVKSSRMYSKQDEQYEAVVDVGGVRRFIVYGRENTWFALARNKYRHIVWMAKESHFNTVDEAKAACEKWLSVLKTDETPWNTLVSILGNS